MRWLLRPLPRALLESIGAEASITHSRLDACPPGQARHHLRSILVNAGVLPPRDEHTSRLETWVHEYLAHLPPRHAAVIGPYAQWQVLRTIRRRALRRRTSIGVATSSRERIRVAGRLLRHVEDGGGSIESLDQSVLDRWVGGNATRTRNISAFISWLNRRNHGRPPLRVPGAKLPQPSDIGEHDQHHALIRALIRGGDGMTRMDTRVAGLLILLYGARIEVIHRLTTTDITTAGERTYLALSTQPIELPTVLADIVRELALQAQLKRRSASRTDDAPYLFASPRRPNESVHPTTLGRWLSKAGVRPTTARNHAMLTLTSDLPAAVIAAQMGLSAQTATRWAQFSQRDNIQYLVSRHAGSVT